MKSIAVYCGSSTGNNPEFKIVAQQLGRIFGMNQTRLIYGGAKVGLMGYIADEVLRSGGEVIGVIPKFLSSKEVAHDSLTTLILVETMHERKEQMFQLSDAFIAMPGGYGTLEELFEMITWAQLGLHQKPIGILNILGYFDPLEQQIDKMVRNGFLKKENKELLLFSNTVADLLDKMKKFKPLLGKKWISDIEQT